VNTCEDPPSETALGNSASEVLPRVLRNTFLTCIAMAIAAFVSRPEDPRLAFGVLGGGVLIGLAIWAIRGAVEQATTHDETGEIRRISRTFALVKFFTRHAILALAAYGMMLRLHFDPLGLLVGVTSVAVAVAFEAGRRR
jgi:hypothetical protein